MFSSSGPFSGQSGQQQQQQSAFGSFNQQQQQNQAPFGVGQSAGFGSLQTNNQQANSGFGSGGFGSNSSFGNAGFPQSSNTPSAFGTGGFTNSSTPAQNQGIFGQSSAFPKPASTFGQPSSSAFGNQSNINKISPFNHSSSNNNSNSGFAGFGGNQSGQSAGFGSSSTFGSGNGGAFGGNNSSSAFGGANAGTSSVFGSTTVGGTGFQSSLEPKNGGGGFGSGGFGTSSSSTFGSTQPPSSVFGNQSSNNSFSGGFGAGVAAFGASSNSHSFTNTFGSSQTAGTFGTTSISGNTPSLSGFGKPTSSLFGTSLQSSTGFQSISATPFGGTPSSNPNAPQSSVFGGGTTQSTFGNFGTTASVTPFGQTSTAVSFGQPAATNNVFGQTMSQSSNFGQSSSVFGSNTSVNQPSSSSIFGGPPQPIPHTTSTSIAAFPQIPFTNPASQFTTSGVILSSSVNNTIDMTEDIDVIQMSDSTSLSTEVNPPIFNLPSSTAVDSPFSSQPSSSTSIFPSSSAPSSSIPTFGSSTPNSNSVFSTSASSVSNKATSIFGATSTPISVPASKGPTVSTTPKNFGSEAPSIFSKVSRPATFSSLSSTSTSSSVSVSTTKQSLERKVPSVASWLNDLMNFLAGQNDAAFAKLTDFDHVDCSCFAQELKGVKLPHALSPEEYNSTSPPTTQTELHQWIVDYVQSSGVLQVNQFEADRFAHFSSALLGVYKLVGKDGRSNVEKMAKAVGEVMRTYGDFLPSSDVRYHVAFIRLWARYLVDLSHQADVYAVSKKESKRYVYEGSQYLRDAINRIISDRAKYGDLHQLEALPYLIIYLFKTYSKLNTWKMFSSFLINIEQARIPLNQFSQKFQVPINYYRGLHALNEENISNAEYFLGYAFEHSQSRKNRKVVLRDLIAPRIILGKFPSVRLLEKFNLESQYKDILFGIKYCKWDTIRLSLERNQTYFEKCGNWFMLKEGLPVLVWREVVKRVITVHRTFYEHKPATKAQLIHLSNFVVAFDIAFPDESHSLNDAGIILASLLEQGYLMGYVSIEREFYVLPKRDPTLISNLAFAVPKLANARQLKLAERYEPDELQDDSMSGYRAWDKLSFSEQNQQGQTSSKSSVNPDLKDRGKVTDKSAFGNSSGGEVSANTKRGEIKAGQSTGNSPKQTIRQGSYEVGDKNSSLSSSTEVNANLSAIGTSLSSSPNDSTTAFGTQSQPTFGFSLSAPKPSASSIFGSSSSSKIGTGSTFGGSSSLNPATTTTFGAKSGGIASSSLFGGNIGSGFKAFGQNPKGNAPYGVGFGGAKPAATGEEKGSEGNGSEKNS